MSVDYYTAIAFGVPVSKLIDCEPIKITKEKTKYNEDTGEPHTVKEIIEVWNFSAIVHKKLKLFKDFEDVEEFLDKYKLRVVAYDNYGPNDYEDRIIALDDTGQKLWANQGESIEYDYHDLEQYDLEFKTYILTAFGDIKVEPKLYIISTAC